jgi:hypothetical protein
MGKSAFNVKNIKAVHKTPWRWLRCLKPGKIIAEQNCWQYNNDIKEKCSFRYVFKLTVHPFIKSADNKNLYQHHYQSAGKYVRNFCRNRQAEMKHLKAIRNLV